MATVSEPLSVQHTPRLASWLPLLVLPATFLILGADWPAWTLMWSLSFAIYSGFKWLTFADATIASPTNARSLAYLLLWPGMDADTFLDRSRVAQEPTLAERLHAVLKLTLGLALIILAKQMVSEHPLIGGWAGIAGVAFVLHFGLLHLLSTFWRDLGIQAVPIMNAPIMASSLSDFWGRRWNLAFRDLAHTYVFRPSVGSLGVAGATMAVFVVSGFIHDFVISTAVGAGFGLPTLYFVIQGVGLLFERCRIGKRIGLGIGAIGRLYCAVVILGPVGFLFHRPFVEQIVIPMLRAL